MFIFRMLILTGFSLVFTLATAQISVESIEQAAEAALAAYDVPGFSVGIIKDGKVVMAKGFGVLEKGQDTPVDEHSIFAIASNTKAFIGTGLSLLAEEEKLSLDDPVRQHLPYFGLYDDYVSNHATIRDLLSHRMGLGTFSGDVIWYKSELSAREVVERVQFVDQAYEWRAGYGYTNLMFITAGEVIGAVSGQPWNEFLADRFFQPLGMTRTFTSINKLAGLDNVATPHITRHDNQAIPYANWDNMGAAGGILSSAHDMLRWIELQLDQGEFRGQRIFAEATQTECWKPHNPIGTSENFLSYGLGWFLYTKGDQRIVTHGGGYDGMYSRLTLVPDQELGIVILTNSMTGLSSSLANYIVDSYLGRDTEGWLENAIAGQKRGDQRWQDRHQKRLDARVMGTQPSVETQAYIGVYEDPMYGQIIINESGEGLQLHFSNAPALDATLTHWHYDTWQINWKEPHAWFDFGTVQFVLDNNRKVTGIRFDVPNDDIFFDEIEADKIDE